MADQNINNQTVTWNSGGTTFNAIKMNVTDTASAAASLLLLLQVGGSDKFKIGKDGKVTLTNDLDVGAGNSILSADNIVASSKVTVFTASGTFTPDAKMVECEVWAWGGGGAGGGAAATGVGTVGAACGGNGGAKAYLLATAATIGASKAVTIGAGGTGVSGGDGNAGAATTLGALLSAKGGEGGKTTPAATAVGPVPSSPTQSATGTVRGWTYTATQTAYSTTSGFSVNGTSGAGELGGGQPSTGVTNGTNGNANTGAGGGGTINVSSQAAKTGGNGGSGIMIIKEYLHP